MSNAQNTAVNDDLAALGLDGAEDKLAVNETATDQTIAGDAQAGDDLAGLGLDLDATKPVEGLAQVEKESPTEAAEDKTRKPVVLGEVTVSDEPEELEGIQRGGAGRESKYDFSDIKPPVDKGEGKYAYYSKSYKPGAGTEAEELDRSVKSAATQATRAARESGQPERYSTRAIVENGVQVGTKVLRVDNTTGIDEAYAARAKRAPKTEVAAS